MTQDALNYGNQLSAQLSAENQLRTKHLAAVKQYLSELPADQLSSITTTINTYHDGIVSGIQTTLSNLTDTYTTS